MGNITIDSFGKWFRGEVWRPIERGLYNYQEVVDEATSRAGKTVKRSAYAYQEGVDEFVGSVVGRDPSKITIHDRTSSLFFILASLNPAGCGSDSVSSNGSDSNLLKDVMEPEKDTCCYDGIGKPSDDLYSGYNNDEYNVDTGTDANLITNLGKDSAVKPDSGGDKIGEDSAAKPDMGSDKISNDYDTGKAEIQESIPCGVNACNAQTEVCCVDVLSGKGPVCIDAQDICEGTVVACDGPEDCTDALCCAEATFKFDIAKGKKELNGNTECTSFCNFSFDFDPLTGQIKVTARACHDSGDCTTTEPVCCNTPGLDAGMCLTTSAAALAEDYTYGLMDCK